MKKSLLALAALTAFAGAASAQSSVTLFGVVDLAARNVKNGSAGDISSLSQDGNASSRFGVRGVEDLGGGLRAGFWLEAGVNPDVGGSNTAAATTVSPTATSTTAPISQFWNRRSTVSLLGGFGEIRLGRDYTPTFWNHTVFDPFGTNGVGSQTNIQGTAGSPALTLVRANNTIGYFLPAMGGLYGQVQVAAGEGVDANKYVGGRIGYGAGPFNIAVAYGVTTATVADDLKAMNVGASYNLGFLTLYGQYHKYEFGAADQQNVLAGVTVPVGAGTIKASYGTTELSSGPKATQIAVGYVYDMSKRTSVYAHFAQVDNDAGLRYTAGSGGPSAAAISGFKSTGYEFGVRHSF